MSGDKNSIEDEEETLQEIRKKVDSIEKNTNVNTELHKSLNRDELLNVLLNRFGGSDNKKKCWYYANDDRSISEISEEADIREGNVRSTFSDLYEDDLVIKRKDGTQTYYDKSKITEDIGIEIAIADELDDI
jgi:DNA-binding transcriptional ArsR family regulator